MSEERAFAPRFVPSTSVRRFFDDTVELDEDTKRLAMPDRIQFSLAVIALVGIVGIAIGSLVALLT